MKTGDEVVVKGRITRVERNRWFKTVYVDFDGAEIECSPKQVTLLKDASDAALGS